MALLKLLNQREKRKKGGAIEGRRRYIVGERIETILELFFKAFFFKKIFKGRILVVIWVRAFYLIFDVFRKLWN